MENVIQDIMTPVWWITVVIAGIVVNVLAAYLKKLIDKWGASFSLSRREKQVQLKLERGERIQKLKHDKHSQVMAGLGELRNRMNSHFLMMMSIFYVSLCLAFQIINESYKTIPLVEIATSFLLLSSVVILVMAVNAVRRAARINSELLEAQSDNDE